MPSSKSSKKSHKKVAVIPFRQTLFWDVNPKNIDPKKHAVYIIERILDFGNEKEVRWMFHYYSPRLIKKVVESSRVVDVKSRSLWSLIYALKKSTLTISPP